MISEWRGWGCNWMTYTPVPVSQFTALHACAHGDCAAMRRQFQGSRRTKYVIPGGKAFPEIQG
eukprot:1360014-Amorphochlora_amoeboformis.AAC.2